MKPHCQTHHPVAQTNCPRFFLLTLFYRRLPVGHRKRPLNPVNSISFGHSLYPDYSDDHLSDVSFDHIRRFVLNASADRLLNAIGYVSEPVVRSAGSVRRHGDSG